MLLCLIAIYSNAQFKIFNQFKNLKPRNIGPAGMSGRVTSIDAVWANSNIIYLGTASGGVWKSENGGGSWNPVFDEQPIQNIGAVAITQSNPSIVWAGTGEGNPRNSLNIGEGIYKSLDGGKTWKVMGLQKTRNIHRIIIDPTNANTVYVGAIGNPFDEHPERGLFKTTDGGETWQHILKTNDTSGVADMIIDPSNPNKLLVAMWQHRRTPWSFTSGGEGSGLYITYDAGRSFKKLGKADGLPVGNYGRIGLTISRSEPNIIYAMVEATKNGLYKTTDGGAKWQLVNETPAVVTNRPFYFQDIAVDPKNENRLYNIYQEISVSEDGGKNFRSLIPYSGVHPDHHAWWIHPNDPNFIIDGNDGGISITRDRGKTWQFDEKLPLGQFYHINVDNQFPYNVMGGLQDNGSWRGPAYTWIGGGIRNGYWENLWGGDGFDVMPDPDDANWVYAMSQGGSLGRYNTQTGESWRLKPPATDLITRLRFNWNAALAQDPFDNNTIYYGSQFVHKSNNKGVAWQTISPDLTTNNPEYQKQDENGGLTIDITNAENHCTILAIEPSTKEKGTLWVGTDDGNVQLTRDGGKTWTNFRGKIPGLPIGAWIPQIRASKYNAGEAFVVANDYRRGDFKPYIFRTRDYGKTWEQILNDKQVKGYALCMIQDPAEPNLLFAGTEQGLWISLDNGKNFQQYDHGYPSVSTFDLAIQEREADLVIATFGRALWVLDDIRPLRKLASFTGQPFKGKLTAFEPPVAYQANFRNVPGVDYSSWGTYEGENRRQGAMLSFFVERLPTDTGKAKLADSVTVKIYNQKNEAIRTLKAKADTGLNRIYWRYETAGIRSPGSTKPRPNAPEQAGGPQAEAGTYKVVYTLGKEKDSTLLTVKDDPRVKIDPAVRAAKIAFNERINKSMKSLTDLTDKMADAEEAIKKVETMIKDVEGKEADSLRKTGKIMQDSIKNIRDHIFGKKQEKQGYGSPYQLTVMSTLNQARQTASGKPFAPAEQEDQLATIAESMVADVLKLADNFFNNQWKNYRTQVEAMPMKIFKD